ncbi:MAG: iron dicitrate transport regulator FecR [Burkholderiales bacterium]|nr:iron dicitrate transport regulator FecR [Burkholderiales bacterium]
MTQHALQGRTDDELLWFQRRSFLQAAAAWSAVGALGSAHAQARGNIVELLGDATVNGKKLGPNQSVQTGDEIVTGPKSTLIFTLGNSAFHVRQNSNMVVERGSSLTAVSVLRLLTGAVVSVWGKGSNRQIVTPTLTAGIRGTGVYTEVSGAQNNRSYFCNCYGIVDLAAGNDHEVSESSYHQAVWAEPTSDGRSFLTPARAINHTDEELEYLARLIGQRTAWQISGKKGTKTHEREYGG